MSPNLVHASFPTPRPLAAALLAIAAASLPGAASATSTDPLDAHYFFGTPTGMSVLPPSLPEVAGAGSYTSADGLATATLTFAPEASVQLTLTGSTYVGAAFEYGYQITGPGSAPFDFVDGTLTTSMSASGTGNMVAAAAIVGTGLTLGHDTGVCYSTLGLCPGTFGSALTGQAIAVSFASSGTIEIATAAKVYFAGSASVFIDPVIGLPEGYTLTLTPGVGNGVPADVPPPVSAVPEPTTVASMGAGLALLALVRRRKRSAVGVARD